MCDNSFSEDAEKTLTEDHYFGADRFRSALQDFVSEVWKNRNQAATESGIESQDLYESLGEGRLLRPWQINAMLNTALYERRLTKEGYDYWYWALHRELIFVRMMSAWLYSETDKRIKDPDQFADAIEHNQVLKENLAKEFAFLESVVDTVFRAGGYTWSFATLYYIIRRSKRSKEVAEVVLPSEWLVYFLDLFDPIVGFELPGWDELTDEFLDEIVGFIRKAPVVIWRIATDIIKRWGQ